MNQFDETFVSDMQGNAFNDEGHIFSVAEQDFFKEAVGADTVMFSEVLPSEWCQGIQIITYLLYAKDGTRQGLLCGLFDIANFSQGINEAVEHDEYICVVDSQGNYINCFDRQHLLDESENFWTDFGKRELKTRRRKICKKRSAMVRRANFIYTRERVHRYGCHIPLGVKDWQVVLTVDETAVSSHTRSIRAIYKKEASVQLVCLCMMLLCVYLRFKTANNEVRKVNQELNENNKLLQMVVDLSDHIIFVYDMRSRSVEMKTNVKNPIFRGPMISSVPESILEKMR